MYVCMCMCIYIYIGAIRYTHLAAQRPANVAKAAQEKHKQ